jgi:SAM-dependent methyltransferase
MAEGFTLRDATAYNLQFHRSRPVLIDTLSFERAEPGMPWIGYRQFCEHFLAPLALMAHRDVRLGRLLRDHIDGVPVDLAAGLLPRRTLLNLGIASHLHAHGRAQRRHNASADGAVPARPKSMSKLQQEALIDNLRRTIEALDWTPEGTEWADYAENTSYADEAARSKDELVERALREAGGRIVWDLGANTGRFSAIAARLGREVVAWDVDPAATERHYRALKRDGVTAVLPLLLDLGNPSPALGWAHEERRSWLDRAEADTVLALALVHHLAIGRNVPFERIAALFARLAPNLVVEWVPKDDPMVRRLLATREDVFPHYTVEAFTAALGAHFDVVTDEAIAASGRRLLRLRRRVTDPWGWTPAVARRARTRTSACSPATGTSCRAGAAGSHRSTR